MTGKNWLFCYLSHSSSPSVDRQWMIDMWVKCIFFKDLFFEVLTLCPPLNPPEMSKVCPLHDNKVRIGEYYNLPLEKCEIAWLSSHATKDHSHVSQSCISVHYPDYLPLPFWSGILKNHSFHCNNTLLLWHCYILTGNHIGTFWGSFATDNAHLWSLWWKSMTSITLYLWI